MFNFLEVTQHLLKTGLIPSSALLKGKMLTECPPVKKSSKARMWKGITFLLVLPALIGVAACVIMAKTAEAPYERPEFIPYEYLRRRTKRFPWGDGQRSFFHNPKVNPLPDGYEDLEADASAGDAESNEDNAANEAGENGDAENAGDLEGDKNSSEDEKNDPCQ